MSLAAKLRQDFPSVKKVALAFSGGLDSIVAGKLLLEAGFEVLPVVVDIGQQSDFAKIQQNAKSVFSSCKMVDAKGLFCQNTLKALKANFGSDGRLNSGGLSRPAIASVLSKIALESGCQAVAHGSSGIGNEHLILENSFRALAPELLIIAPVRDLDLKRDVSIQLAAKERLPVNLMRAKKFSADENLWGRTIRQGIAVDASSPLPKEAYKWTRSPQEAPSKPQEIEVGFVQGVPVYASAGKEEAKDPVAIFQLLNSVGGRHAIGRFDGIEDKAVGLKSHEVYECPAAAILLFAHRQLEALTLTVNELEASATAGLLWAKVVRQGGWYSRLKRSLDAFIDSLQQPVEGQIQLELYKGNIILKGRKSDRALYDSRLSRSKEGVFSQRDAKQFAKLYGLQDVMAYALEK
ncbi:MAG: argininosuccinate synthase [Candidatus Micrarchaeota archaeon]|nr:argininosuccinate synthase [Candidatus Micrarchaeota archaeon]